MFWKILIGVLYDFSKAFDCVYHDNLVKKLRHYVVTSNSKLQFGLHISKLTKQLSSALCAIKKYFQTSIGALQLRSQFNDVRYFVLGLYHRC